MRLSKKRILIVDDTVAIHEDFRQIFEASHQDSALAKTRAMIFESDNTHATKNTELDTFIIDSAYQGQEALELVRQAKQSGQPYALAFVDIRMPPGWDGIETIQKIWEVDPEIQIVICSAYSDYSWSEIAKTLANSNNYLILKKPFDVIEICQLTSALTKKWELNRQVQFQIENLEKSISLTKATLEATLEGILVLDQNGQISMYNKNFLNLWNIPESLISSEQSDIVLGYMADQVENADYFLIIMTGLGYPASIENSKKSIKEWRLKSGKFLELYIHPQLHHHKIIGSVCSFRDVTERKKLEEELLHQAMHDSLTGLPNRVLLTDRIQQGIAFAHRQGSCVGILLLDLDNFKQVNDTLGHGAGDNLLKMISKKLVSCVRESDTVTRLGGDEFVIVLASHLSEDDLVKKAHEIIEAFSQPFSIIEHKLTITTSIGISVYPKNGQDAETLLKNADAALYYAKETGKNSFQFYQDQFNEHILKQAELTTALRQALNNNELMLYYQPLVELNGNKIIGVEALLRWIHPTMGVLLPNTFIPLAEKTGLILPIGEWVLRTACLQNKSWQQSGYTDLCIAVNISGHQFKQANFVELVSTILTETGLEPCFLELEITENLLLEDITDITKKMGELKKLGVHFSIDDFGTGYASLNYLRYFPFDKVKIDKNFIDGITLNKADNSIVEAIIDMTKTMEVDVLAEGVEKSEQVDFLRKHHSNQVQGYYFSPPIDAQKLEDLLKKQEESKSSPEGMGSKL